MDYEMTAAQRVTVELMRNENWQVEHFACTEDGSTFVELSGPGLVEEEGGPFEKGVLWVVPNLVRLFGWAAVCECERVLPDLVRKCTCGRGQNCLDHEG